jgi:hypothetical protein
MVEPTKLLINGEAYEIPDMTDLNLGELKVMSELLGMPLSQAQEELPGNDPRMIAAVAYLAMHRKDPSVTSRDIAAIRLKDIDVEAPPPPLAKVEEPEADRRPPALGVAPVSQLSSSAGEGLTPEPVTSEPVTTQQVPGTR